MPTRWILALGLCLGTALPAMAMGLPEPPSHLTLDQAIAHALEHNPQILAARADVARADLEVASARLSPLRTVSANIGLNTLIGTNGGLPAPAGGAYLSINLGDLLATPLVMAGAGTRLTAAKEGLRLTILQVVAATTGAFGTWNSQQRLLALRNEAIRSSQSEVVVTERLFGKGNATLNDLMKARLAASQSMVDLAAAEGEAQRAWALLLVQMGESDWLEPQKKSRPS